MQTLVVWAHPRRDSFSHAVLETAVGALQRGGHRIDVIDLYGERYQPAMSPAEWLAYSELRAEPDDIAAAHIELLRVAEQLVFIYPTWWFGLPAVLKGWLERTMVPGVAFRIDEHGAVRGNLAELRRIVGIATYGSAPWYVRLIGDAGRRTLDRTVRMSTPNPLKVRVQWYPLYRMDSIDDDQRRAFLDRIERDLARPGGLRSWSRRPLAALARGHRLGRRPARTATIDVTAATAVATATATAATATTDPRPAGRSVSGELR